MYNLMEKMLSSTGFGIWPPPLSSEEYVIKNHIESNVSFEDNILICGVSITLVFYTI